MKTIKYVCIMLIALGPIMGCTGNYAKIKTQSVSESRITQQELIENWEAYNIYCTGSYYEISKGPFKTGAIVFEPKNDDRKILVGSDWDKIQDQETWTEIVKANTTSQGDFDLDPPQPLYLPTRVREIRGTDNQLYAFIITRNGAWVVAKKVDNNTMRLQWQTPGGGGVK